MTVVERLREELGQLVRRCAGSGYSIAWNPPECQVVNTMCGVSVGLCAEYEVRGGFQSSHVDSWFSGSLYSASTVGVVGSEMSIIRAQPHGQPWSDPVAVP